MFLNCGVGEDSWGSCGQQEIKPGSPKGNQSWIFIGRTDAEAETSLLWPPDAKNGLNGKDPDAGNDWRQEEKGMTEDEMVRWHHWLNGREFEQALGVGDGQGSLACCSPWGCKKSDKTEQLNWTGGGLVTKLCPTPCNPMDYSAPGHFLLQGIFWIQGSNLCLLPGRQSHYLWVTWEAHHQIRWFQSTDDNLKRYYPGFLSLPSYGGLDILLKECLLIFSFT